MRRGIAAVFAVGAVIGASAAGAQASGPVWYSCLKAAKSGTTRTGAYENSTCSTESAGHDGKWELMEGLGKKVKMSGKAGAVPGGSGRPVYLEVAIPGGDLQWSCTTAKETGVLAATNRVAETLLTLKGCGVTSEGDSPGTLEVGPLSGELGYLDEGHTEVGLDLTSQVEPGGTLAEFTDHSDGASFVLRGSMIGRLTGDLAEVGKVFFTDLHATESLGETEPGYRPVTDEPSFFGGPQDVLEIEQVAGKEVLTPGEHPAALQLELKNKGPAVLAKRS